jgi:hypothetical protein
MAKGYNTVRVALGASDSTKTLVAAPESGMAIKVWRIRYNPTTQAAQAITVATGSTTFMIIASNIAIGVAYDTGWLNGGILGAAETALIATPASAGPAGDFFVSYTVE